MDKTVAAVASIGSVLTATLIGGGYGPQHPRTAVWYAALRKPSYTPPGPAIGAAWTVLDGLLMFTGYRLMTARPGMARTMALTGWVGSVLGLAGYPAIFFGRRKLGAGAVASSGLLTAAATTTASAAQVDGPAALASMPLVLWTGFATLLSEELWRRN